jgi:flagellar L-ring protein precursor FlgH
MRSFNKLSLMVYLALCCAGLLPVKVVAAQVPNLFSDQPAIKVDDILTILIVESAQAGSECKTNTSKSQSLGVQSDGGTGLLRLLPQFGASGSANVGYDGSGGTSRTGSLNATIAVRVTKVLDNGNLMIEGTKVVEVNDEKGLIKVTGLVRPHDIQPNNMIYSSNIADAQITYSGKGAVNDGHRPGFLARFFNWIF